uniref:Uncharacterized protein n=1 Tax=Opuntia streptacantha TaxID=393608 RepID=A0A7C9EUB1_OPUST
MMRFPLLLGSFESGIPSSGITISRPGFTISETSMVRFLPSKVVRLSVFPVRASRSESLWWIRRSFPSLLNVEWGFSSMTNIRSPGSKPASWFPFSGKVIFVPFFQPGLISIANTSSTVLGLPESSDRILEIFIFLLEPLYNSSKVHANLFSTGAAFFPVAVGRLLLPLFPLRKFTLSDLGDLPLSLPPSLPKSPKKSSNISSASL